MFQLFLLSGVLGERLGDALGAMHLTAFSLLTACAFLRQLTYGPLAAVRYLLLVLIAAGLVFGGTYATLRYTLRFAENKHDFIAKMQLLEEPVTAVVYREAAANPEPLLPGESLLDRIRRRGVIRAGYNEDKLPFAYFNQDGELVGYDINMVHALARDLGVAIEFVPFDRATLAEQLQQDDFDVVMSGLVGTLERSEAMQHTQPYMSVTLALVVRDYRVRQFKSLTEMQQADRLRIAFVDLSQGFVDRLSGLLPRAEFVELRSNREFFDAAEDQFDALLISAESGSAFTLLYPDFEVVVPSGPRVSMPLFYAVGNQDAKMTDFLEHWLDLRQRDGTTQQYYDHWILGKTAGDTKRRWCIARDVLHWLE
jgi:ABC-type amino acid transport substrate-binding protein